MIVNIYTLNTINPCSTQSDNNYMELLESAMDAFIGYFQSIGGQKEIQYNQKLASGTK